MASTRVGWKIHGDGRTVAPGEVVRPDERLNMPYMLGLGGQHILAMFGATALVPVLTGFPVTTTIFFSGVGTIIFNLLTRNRVPSYTGSSFAFIAPVLAAKSEGLEAALAGIVAAGVALFLVGLLVDRVGWNVFEFLFPPIVTGSIVALIGLNLAPVAWQQFEQQAGLGMITLVAILIIGVAVKSFLSRMSVFLGVVLGYVVAGLLGDVNWDGVDAASWFGFPDFMTPDFNMRAILLVVPGVLLVLMAENAGHVKAVATMTERDLDPMIGRSFMGDGVATTLSGMFGGSGTTTYAENIGVMGYTRIYSTLAYLIAGAIAIGLGLLPKFGAIITAIPIGVLGGAVTVLVRHDRRLGRAHLDRGQRGFPRPREPGHGGGRADRRHRQLHAELGRLLVRRHRARHDRRDPHLPGAAVLPARAGRARHRYRRPAGRAAGGGAGHAEAVKPAPFAYHRPGTREEVDGLLAELGPEAKLLAGGQSLIPILNMRLAAPAHLIDLNFLRDEPAEPVLDDGALVFGPLVRQAAAERSPLVAERLPLMHEVLQHVAHPAIRSRGTVVGSIAHADPAAELPALFVLLEGEARVQTHGPDGARVRPVREPSRDEPRARRVDRGDPPARAPRRRVRGVRAPARRLRAVRGRRARRRGWCRVLVRGHGRDARPLRRRRRRGGRRSSSPRTTSTPLPSTAATWHCG